MQRRRFRPGVVDLLEPRRVPSSYLVSGVYSGVASISSLSVTIAKGTASGGDLSSSSTSVIGRFDEVLVPPLMTGRVVISGMNKEGVHETIDFTIPGGTFGPDSGGGVLLTFAFTENMTVGDMTTETTGNGVLDLVPNGLRPGTGSVSGELVDLL
jgi:hypothetical protein